MKLITLVVVLACFINYHICQFPGQPNFGYTKLDVQFQPDSHHLITSPGKKKTLTCFI